MTQLSGYAKEGYQLFWYETDLFYDNGIRGWRKEAVDAYIDYLLETDNKISVVSTPDFTFRSIILYPEENNTNLVEAEKFSEYVKNSDLRLFKTISGVNIYIKQ
jgi:hypothetical protein